MIKIKNIESGYGKLKILKNISLHVKKGEIVTIIGANGAGKSTLLRTISGLIKPFSGEIYFKDKNVSNLDAEKIVKSGCLQVPEGRLVFASMTVEENLILGSYTKIKLKGKKEISKSLKKSYELFPRLLERKHQLAGTLSGGEQQMLAMARALMADPDLIMLDEPSMGLAPLVVKTIFKIISNLKNLGKTILLVEQNAKASLSIADRAYVLETGNIIMEGTSSEFLENNDIQRAYLGKDYREFTDK